MIQHIKYKDINMRSTFYSPSLSATNKHIIQQARTEQQQRRVTASFAVVRCWLSVFVCVLCILRQTVSSSPSILFCAVTGLKFRPSLDGAKAMTKSCPVSRVADISRVVVVRSRQASVEACPDICSWQLHADIWKKDLLRLLQLSTI